MKQEISWNRFSVEAIVIVGSILLAFAIDAGWENVQNEADKREMLLLLKSQFEENLSILDDELSRHEFAEQRSRNLLGISTGRIPWPGYEETMTSLSSMFAYSSFNSSSGAVESFLNSDSSRLLNNPNLQSQIAAWPSQIQENNEDEIRLVSLVDNHFKPYLRSSIPFSDALTLLNAEEVYGIFEREVVPPDIQPVVLTQGFANLMVERASLEVLLQRENRRLIAAAESILELIDLELDS